MRFLPYENDRARARSLNLLASTALARLEEPTTFYVDPHGDDRGNGSQGDPWATTQHAFDALGAVDFYGHDAALQLSNDALVGGVAVGLWSSRACLDGFSPVVWNNTPTLFIQGDAADASLSSLTPISPEVPCILSVVGTQTVNVGIRNLTLDYTSPPTDAAITYIWGCNFFIGDGEEGTEVRAESVTGDLFSLCNGSVGIQMSKLHLEGTYDFVYDLGHSELNVWAETEIGTANFGGCFIRAQDKSVAVFDGATFTVSETGSATGKRFDVLGGSHIDVTRLGGSSRSTLPGSVAGTLGSGGAYYSATEHLRDVSHLPTADPHVVGMMWNSAGTLKVSAG